MNIKEFKLILQYLEELYNAAGAASAAKDLQGVAKLLDGHDAETVDAFASRTRLLLDRPSAPSASRAAVDEGRVAAHAERLLKAGADQSAFDAAFKDLARDRAVSRLEWFAIANQYRNAPTGGTYVNKFKSIKEAQAAIRGVFIERFESESKRGVIDRLTRWVS